MTIIPKNRGLAYVTEGAESTCFGRFVDVGVLENNYTGFATEFCDNWFQMLPSDCRNDGTDCRAAGEVDLFHKRVSNERIGNRSGIFRAMKYKVKAAVWETSRSESRPNTCRMLSRAVN
jgi:hypothetical protein